MKNCGPVLVLLRAGLLALLLSGCSANQYRKSADKEIYGIIQNAQQGALGQTNAFNIDTAYSDRKPTDIFPAELIDSRVQTNRQALTVEKALALAVANSREYQIAKDVLYRAALNLSNQRYQYKPVLDAGGQPIKIENGQWSSSGAATLSFSQLLKSGGQISSTLASGVIRYYTGDPQRSAVTTLAVDILQPLLRGFGKDNPNVESLTQAERDVVYAVRTFSFYQHQFALNVVNEYFRLLQQKDNIRNGYTNYLRRVEATQRLEARKDRESVWQVDQARQNELSSRNSYIDLLAAFLTSLDQFKVNRLGLPAGTELLLDDQALYDLQHAGLIPTWVDPFAAYRIAVQRKLTLLNDIDRFEDSKRKVSVAASQLKMGLDVFGGATYEWSNPEDYTRFDPSEIRYAAGVNLNLPFDRLQQRNAYRSTLISFESQLRAFTLVLDTLKNNIDDGLRTLEQRRQNYDIQKKARDLANRRVDSTTLLLKAGRVEVRDLNDALDSLVLAEIQVTLALIRYQEARLQLMLDIGALATDVPNFWLKDHIVSYLPEKTVPRPQGDTSDQPLPTPDQFFNR